MGPNLSPEVGAHRDVCLLGEIGWGESLRVHLSVGVGGSLSARWRGLVTLRRGWWKGTLTVGSGSRFLCRCGAPLCLTQSRVARELRVGGGPAGLP